jgi:hypothetical protein
MAKQFSLFLKIAFDNMNLAFIIFLVLPIFPPDMTREVYGIKDYHYEDTYQKQEGDIQLRDN